MGGSPTRRARLRAPGVPAAAAALGVLLFAALDWAAVHTVPGRLVDGRSLRGALLTESPAASLLERALDLISVSALLCAVSGILLIALLRQRRDVGLAALSVLAGANVSTQVLKQVLVRPDLGLVERTPATLNSLPSGHVTVALSVVVALVLVLPARLRPVAAGAGLAFTGAVTMAVMSSGWHRASDAVAACLVVGVWAAVVLLVLELAPGVHRAPQPSAPPSLWVRAAVVLVGTGALATLALLTVLAPGGAPVLLASYAAGVGLTTGTAAAVLAVVLAQLPRADLPAAEAAAASGDRPRAL